MLGSLARAIFDHDATAAMGGVLLMVGARLQPAPTAAPRQAPPLTLGDQRIRERGLVRPDEPSEPQAAVRERDQR
jgi:hypothetical protein